MPIGRREIFILKHYKLFSPSRVSLPYMTPPPPHLSQPPSIPPIPPVQLQSSAPIIVVDWSFGVFSLIKFLSCCTYEHSTQHRHIYLAHYHFNRQALLRCCPASYIVDYLSCAFSPPLIHNIGNVFTYTTDSVVVMFTTFNVATYLPT